MGAYSRFANNLIPTLALTLAMCYTIAMIKFWKRWLVFLPSTFVCGIALLGVLKFFLKAEIEGRPIAMPVLLMLAVVACWDGRALLLSYLMRESE